MELQRLNFAREVVNMSLENTCIKEFLAVA